MTGFRGTLIDEYAVLKGGRERDSGLGRRVRCGGVICSVLTKLGLQWRVQAAAGGGMRQV